MVMNSARIFYVLEGITLNINNLTLQNGNTTGEGGATDTATVIPTIGLFPAPISPIIST